MIYILYINQPILSQTYIKRYRFQCSPTCSDHKAHNTIKSEERYTGSWSQFAGLIHLHLRFGNGASSLLNCHKSAHPYKTVSKMTLLRTVRKILKIKMYRFLLYSCASCSINQNDRLKVLCINLPVLTLILVQ